VVIVWSSLLGRTGRVVLCCVCVVMARLRLGKMACLLEEERSDEGVRVCEGWMGM
jgi:hypothetical protein